MVTPAMETATERHARGVRPIERDDLSQVAALYQSVVYPDQRVERSRLVREFERLLFDQPWADSETPTLRSH